MENNVKLSKIYNTWTDDDEDNDEAHMHYFNNTVLFIKNKSLKIGTFFLHGMHQCVS